MTWLHVREDIGGCAECWTLGRPTFCTTPTPDPASPCGQCGAEPANAIHHVGLPWALALLGPLGVAPLALLARRGQPQ